MKDSVTFDLYADDGHLAFSGLKGFADAAHPTPLDHIARYVLGVRRTVRDDRRDQRDSRPDRAEPVCFTVRYSDGKDTVYRPTSILLDNETYTV